MMKQQAGNYGKGGRKPGQPGLISMKEKPKSKSEAARRQASKDRMKAQARRDVARRKKK